MKPWCLSRRWQVGLVAGAWVAAGVLAWAEEPGRVETAQIAEAPEPAPVKVSLDYRDADITQVLRSFAYSYNLNLVTSNEVKGKVTVNLKDVSIDEALDAILTANGLNYTRRGTVIYINAGGQDMAALVSEPVQLKYLRAADAQQLIRKVLSPKGDVKVDDLSNSLVLTDFPANIGRVKDLLTKMDTAPQQVLIEAKIVDITSKDLHNLGLSYTADWSPRKGIFHRDTKSQESLQTTTSMAGSSSAVSGGQFKIDALTFKGVSFTATLDALIQDQKAHLLASPSIAVLNNQEARIIIGEKVPFKERTQTTTGTSETTKFIDVGTTLRVTPSINPDGYITMRVHPEVSSVSALLDAGPRITTREADTTVRIKEGETLVIAGLIKQEDNRTKSGFPILGRLPVLDYVFGSRSKDQTQTELAVFITPKVLLSRDEQHRLAEQTVKSEAYVTVPTAASGALVTSLFEKADHLQRNIGLESVRKPRWARVMQALNLYDHIAAEFPDNPQAPEALVRMATLYLNPLRDPAKAKVLLLRVLDLYPTSPAAARARRLVDHLERSRTRGPAPASTNFGPARARPKPEPSATSHEVEASERRETVPERTRRRESESQRRGVEQEYRKLQAQEDAARKRQDESNRVRRESEWQRLTDDLQAAEVQADLVLKEQQNKQD